MDPRHRGSGHRGWSGRLVRGDRALPAPARAAHPPHRDHSRQLGADGRARRRHGGRSRAHQGVRHARGVRLRRGRPAGPGGRAFQARRTRVSRPRGGALGGRAGVAGGDQRRGGLAHATGPGDPDRARPGHRPRDRAETGLGPAADRGGGRDADRGARSPGFPNRGRRSGGRCAGRLSRPDGRLSALSPRPRQHPGADRPGAARLRAPRGAQEDRRRSGRSPADPADRDAGRATRPPPHRPRPGGPRRIREGGAAREPRGSAAARGQRGGAPEDGHEGPDRGALGARGLDHGPARSGSPRAGRGCDAARYARPMAEGAPHRSDRPLPRPHRPLHRARRARARARGGGAAHRGARRRRSAVHPRQRR